ncbi:hypothetical protein OHB39_38090 [Streptomyces sp. NBC_00047]|uniref:hypothetical protein n=1 Tax=Streptomyces sp. NBC_00047 TaxID=2975627 RepID=UPI002250E5A0|nr:hypothetical protein [Streptomyces sp. NBC_00047]MCX5613290.1 hypothetical protein [Streptomyces sp. NBC_00047]
MPLPRQEPDLYERLTCDEHIELFGHAYGLSRETEARSRREIYTALGFERHASTGADQLSGGTAAKLSLGLTLLADPEVLLLDELYAGFDFDNCLKFWDLVAAPPGWTHRADHQPLRGGAMTSRSIARRFLTNASRTPTNLLALVLVPVVFVVVAAGPMADAAELLGGPGGPAVQTATAG